MHVPALLAVLLAVASPSRAVSIFFPEMPATDRCETRDGRPGLCVSATARRCAAYPSITALLTLRPRVCRFVAIDPIVCCPTEEMLPETELGQLTGTKAPVTEATTEAATEAPTQPPTQPPTAAPTTASTAAPTAPPTAAPTGPEDLSCGISDPEQYFLLSSGEYRSDLPQDAPPLGTVLLGFQPWSALVGLRTFEGALAWLCGGALVSPQIVLTAAHCAAAGGDPDRLAVRLGEHDLTTETDGGAQDFRVLAVTSHPGFRQPAQRDDLAVLLLDRPVQVTRRVSPVCLPRQGQALPDGTELEVPAFELSGELGNSDSTDRGRLDTHPASISPLSVCSAPLQDLPHVGFIFPGGLKAQSELCVTRPAGGRCSHDSGGPLVAGGPGQRRLVGLRLLSGCQPGQPEVALRVDHYVEFVNAAAAEMLEEAKQTAAEVA